MDGFSPQVVSLSFSLPQTLDQILASPQRKRQNRKRGGLVRAREKHAGVTYVKIRDVVGLSEAVGYKMLGIIAHAAGTGLVQRVAWRVGLVSHTPHLAS